MFTVTDHYSTAGANYQRARAHTSAQYQVRPCRCDCWFCADCCPIKGNKLKHRLVPVLKTFQGVVMVTLTIDPALFPSPRAAHDYLTRQRCVSRSVGELHRRGHTHTKRFFSVMEWQDQTGQVHFHVLLDAVHVPYQDLFDVWSRHRPPAAGPSQPGRPPLGWIWIKAPYFAGGAEQAAHCAASYLIKLPLMGFPQWVMEMGLDRRIRRFSTSRGFWNRPARPRAQPRTRRTNTGRTYADRISECGSTANLFHHHERTNPTTGETTAVQRWVAQMEMVADGNPAMRKPFPRDPIVSASLEGAVEAAERRCGSPIHLLRLRGSRPRAP